MIVRTSLASDPNFNLLTDRMVERATYSSRYMLLRSDLKLALEIGAAAVKYYITTSSAPLSGWVIQGKTQRNKKFISIGCMRFVGENRTKIIRWAKSGK